MIHVVIEEFRGGRQNSNGKLKEILIVFHQRKQKKEFEIVIQTWLKGKPVDIVEERDKHNLGKVNMTGKYGRSEVEEQTYLYIYRMANSNSFIRNKF